MVGAAAKPPASPQPPGNKPRPSAPPREEGSKGRRPGRVPLWLRIFLSLLVVWHFVGVFLAALSVPITSQLVYGIAQHGVMQWYLDALYMNQGHSFFAPSVGPGHVMHYELLDQNGRVYADGELPNRKEQWPRLRYHRHFMLADQAGMPSPDPQVDNYWQRRYLESYARHLLRVNPEAQAVRVRRYAHFPLPRRLALLGHKQGYDILKQELAREGLNLDSQGYELLMDVRQQRANVASPQERSQFLPNDRPQAAQRWIGVPR